MAARAMWKAELAIGAERVPIKLYAGLRDRGVRFHLLHAKDGSPVTQRMAHPRTNRTVELKDQQRGVQVGPRRFIVLQEEELERLAPEPSREIEVTRFLPPSAIDHRWYERPYYLGPDENAQEHYAALAAALEESGREGLAHWTMRKKSYSGALRLHAGQLVLVALRSAQELMPQLGWSPPPGRELQERERKLASQLVAALAGDFDPAEFRDEYAERVRTLVEAKRSGRKVEFERFEPKVDSDDSLLESLEASLRKAG
jgi:DNA end-binding protein Ku